MKPINRKLEEILKAVIEDASIADLNLGLGLDVADKPALPSAIAVCTGYAMDDAFPSIQAQYIGELRVDIAFNGKTTDLDQQDAFTNDVQDAVQDTSALHTKAQDLGFTDIFIHRIGFQSHSIDREDLVIFNTLTFTLWFEKISP